MTDVLDDLRDLQKQATTERSHYYVATCCARAIGEIVHLRQQAKYGWQPDTCIGVITEANSHRQK